MGASYQVRGSIAVITLDNPPVNGLGYDTRREFAAGINRAADDSAISAIKIREISRFFMQGSPPLFCEHQTVL